MQLNWKEYRASKNNPYHVSAGCVVYKFDQDRLMFALLLRKKENWAEQSEDLWFLPKGTLERTETLEQCALRETEEESGLKVEITGYLGAINRKWTDIKGLFRDKTTHFFLAKYLSDIGNWTSDEHDATQWFSAEQAIEKLNILRHKGEAEIATRAKEVLEK